MFNSINFLRIKELGFEQNKIKMRKRTKAHIIIRISIYFTSFGLVDRIRNCGNFNCLLFLFQLK